MTPREFWKRLRDAAAVEDGKRMVGVIEDYVDFAIGAIKKVCNGNVSDKTAWMWVYALRKIADIFDSQTSESDKALMESLDECAKVNVMIATMPDLEELNDDEE